LGISQGLDLVVAQVAEFVKIVQVVSKVFLFFSHRFSLSISVTPKPVSLGCVRKVQIKKATSMGGLALGVRIAGLA